MTDTKPPLLGEDDEMVKPMDYRQFVAAMRTIPFYQKLSETP